MRPSGARNADIVVRALEEYKQNDGREKFSYEHVWAIVKDLPSWQPQFVARQISLNTSSTNQTSSGSVAGTASGSEEVFPRPMGKKAPKRKAKERYSNNDDDDDDIHMESDERKMKWKEYKVLTRNTAGMTEEQLALHEEYCNDIKRRQNAQGP
nr:glutathione S-transferase T3-like [Ipomoea batatas]